jgi:hypothetical protein
MNGKEIVKHQVKTNTENRLKNDTGRTSGGNPLDIGSDQPLIASADPGGISRTLTEACDWVRSTSSACTRQSLAWASNCHPYCLSVR